MDSNQRRRKPADLQSITITISIDMSMIENDSRFILFLLLNIGLFVREHDQRQSITVSRTGKNCTVFAPLEKH